MKEMSDLICGKAAVGGNYNSTCDIYESGEKADENYYRLSGWLMARIYYVWGHLIGRQYGVGYIPYLKFIWKVKSISPDIVHIHCPNGFGINLYAVLRYLGKHKVPVVITNHAEFFLYRRMCVYQGLY